MSCSASNSGRRYGSIFAIRSPGRKPEPLAGLDGGAREDDPVDLVPRQSAAAAIATARNVLPVPAGPMPNVIVLRRIEST